MIRPFSYTLGALLAMSLTANPLHAENTAPSNSQTPHILLAHNDKEGKEDERHEKAEEREKKRHEKKEEKNKKEHGKHKGKKESENEAVKTAPPSETPHVSGGTAPTGQANVSGTATPIPNNSPLHVSGGK